MDKNTILGLLMMAAVVFGFMYLNKPSEEEIQAQKALQEQAERQQRQMDDEAARRAMTLDSITAAETSTLRRVIATAGVADSTGLLTFTTTDVKLTADADGNISGSVNALDTTVSVNNLLANDYSALTRQQAIDATDNLRRAIADGDRYGSFGRHLHGDSATVVLENDLLKLELANKGGIISQATLKEYDTYVGGDTTLVKLLTPQTSGYSFILSSASQRFDTGNFYFTPVVENDSTVLMKLDLEKGAMWGLRYTLRPDSYVVKMEIVQSGMNTIIPSSVASIDMQWSQKMARNETGRTFEERNSGIFYKYSGESPDNLSETSDDAKSLNQKVKWISFKNQFFSSALIPTSAFTAAELKSTVINDDPRYLKQMEMKATMDYSSTSANPASFDLFLGPNLYPLLASLDDTVSPDEDLELTHLIPLGWSLFRWINTLIIIPVFTFLGSFISNYGVIILLLTIFIKIILFPFTYKSYMSQAKMRVLAPEIKEINDKYPGNENAMTRQQKTMQLYSKAGASPFSGCLPLMLQMPVLIAMFSFFPSCIELRGEAFLWAKDLSAPDVILTLPFSIPFYGNHVSLFCLLMTVTNILYTQINMQNQPSSASMPGMKWMMYLMPLMFLFFFNDYASGLSYYYFLSLLITIIQTYIFRRCVNEKKVREQMMANAAKPKKKSGFMARLEEAQRRQQAMLREQQKQQQRRR